ncbi:MAG: hypothetical protein A2279_10725 [Stygiobacter sp. RIFOXYA12_FULL_38_9]|nr:MAG: hypothetical protein A2X62_09550 [Stygiobacter sp. GWC2_38_9]OGU77277.1 MAG: hypothetical protein A2279_10725 [Stygiobacter sp. RIFOXYA12_FULL_38_9]OGV09000.1 MAG: hypothetical protein A2299_11245 [Stygiobacter sp. RIFOXYB2_FULL_37_11]OGV14183.1 MAG: hypothetical protein A2237_13625 [Stygiobacter sp. RIFOXYA2_FULL_38_8]OGV81682.1 MAG: hypothetical protein A2X65_15685 [Stygiobacter sp. GWF2_38_21]RJQ59188.1 MAG: hypothetical protein C4517_13535 [Stygiobacter sp.]
MKRLILIFLFCITFQLMAQTEPTEIYVIDSYITPETPHRLIVTFSTSEECTSVIKIKSSKTFNVSDSLTDNHRVEIDLADLFNLTEIKYRILVKNNKKKETTSEEYEVALPSEALLTTTSDNNWYQMCIGGLVFAIPSMEYLVMDGKDYIGLSKEIPLLNFYGNGYNYPAGYIGLEYSHYLNAPHKNFLRLGYKHMFQFREIKYISPGLSFFGDFKGYNGLSAEVSLGLFQIRNIFTVYTRYRYNFQIKSGGKDFYEFSLGLYSNFFSINL